MILGASILQLPAILKAKELGLNVVVVDMNPNAIGFRENGIIKECISTIDIPKVVEAAKKHKVDGVITIASDMPMRSVAAVVKELGLIGVTMDTAIKATNKYEMRKALREYGVPVPVFYRASNQEQFLEAISHFDSDVIVKPADNSGSRGVVKISPKSKKELLVESYLYSRDSSRNGDVVVEEYMSGPEVSVETMSFNGVCNVIQITDKLTTGAPHFVEMGHSQPSMLDSKIKEQIANIAISANKAIGITDGPSHTEIIVTNEGPKIVELGARLGGDCITTHLVPLSTGVDMVECSIRIALGEKPDITKKYNKGSAIRYFNQHSGVIKSIYGIEKAKQISGIKNVELVNSIGDKIGNIESSVSRIGFVIAQDKDAISAVKDCEKALDVIKIEIGEQQ